MFKEFYSKKLVVVDLIIVTVWAFLNLIHPFLNVMWPAITFIVVRTALCFQMQCKSPWTLFSAVALLLCFVPMSSVKSFGEISNQDSGIWTSIWGILLNFWIVGIPVLIGLLQKNFWKINLRHKWIAVYLLFSVIISIPISVEEVFIGAYVLGFFMSLLPATYWAVYNRKNRSAINLLCHYKPLVIYVAFILLLAICLLTGTVRIGFYKQLALFVMPPLFYVLICLSSKIKPLTRHVIALSVCGGLFFLIFNAPQWVKIISLTISALLALYVAIDIIYRTKRYCLAIAMFILPTFIISPIILALNPYVVIDVDCVSNFHNGKYKNDGLFIIRKDNKLGLRDRFGVIIEPTNERLYFLDNKNNYLALKHDYFHNEGNVYDVFCIPTRRYIIKSEIGIDSIARISENEFMMVDQNGRNFATFTLPQNIRGLQNNVEFKAHYSDAETPVSGFYSLLQDSEIDPDGNPYFQSMMESNPQAYSLLGKICAMSTIDSSPQNDLTFSKAVKTVIETDPYYNGDTERAFNDINELLDILSEGSQHDMNFASSLSRLMTALRLFMDYDRLISANELVREEYEAWHNMAEAIISYSEHVADNTDWYSSKPLETEGKTSQILEDRRELLNLEYQILSEARIPAPDEIRYMDNDSTLTRSYLDVMEVVGKYHSDNSPEYYHPLWHEIKPAYERWLSVRNQISNMLPETNKAAYDAATNALNERFAYHICSLDHYALVPALP